LDNAKYWTQKYFKVAFLLLRVFKYLILVATVYSATTLWRLILFNRIANRLLRDVRHGLQGVLCFQNASVDVNLMTRIRKVRPDPAAMFRN